MSLGLWILVFVIMAGIIISKYKTKPPWYIESILNGLIMGIILFLFTIYLNAIINPLPKVEINCFRNDNHSVYLTIENPSDVVAEEYNALIYAKWAGLSGSSFPGSDLCKVQYHEISPDRITAITCSYIPPKSKTLLQINFENESLNEFNYDSWGKTTPKEEDKKLNCEIKSK